MGTYKEKKDFQQTLTKFTDNVIFEQQTVDLIQFLCQITKQVSTS